MTETITFSQIRQVSLEKKATLVLDREELIELIADLTSDLIHPDNLQLMTTDQLVEVFLAHLYDSEQCLHEFVEYEEEWSEEEEAKERIKVKVSHT